MASSRRSRSEWIVIPLLIGVGIALGAGLHKRAPGWPTLDDAAELLPREHDKAPLRVLFVGNSYTFVNDLPWLVRRLAYAAHEELRFEAVKECPGGSRLKQHWDSGLDAALLRESHFDFIVLQEHSVGAAFPRESLEIESYPYVTKLVAAARAAGTTPLLYMTWGHNVGDPINFRGDTYAAMQARLVTGYETIAARLHVKVAPVGIAWRNALEADARTPLWSEDGSHPSAEGSYLAACVFYRVLYGRSSLGNSFTAGLDAATARSLQTIADETVHQYVQP
jgi:hypothetical protein